MAHQYTYALQYRAKDDTGQEKWKIATTRSHELVTGLLRANPGSPGMDLKSEGSRLLKKLLSMPGADKGFFRVVFWEGDVADEQLDDTLSCMAVYDV